MTRLRAILTAVFRPRRAERDFEKELAAYIEMLEDENAARGLSPPEARRQALIETGGLDSIRESVRDVRPGAFLRQAAQDAAYALRTFRKRAVSTGAAVLAIGVGIGSAAAILSLAEAVLVRTLPLQNLDRTVMVWQQDLGTGRDRMTFSPAEYLDYADGTRSFESIAALQPVAMHSRLDGFPQA